LTTPLNRVHNSFVYYNIHKRRGQSHRKCQ